MRNNSNSVGSTSINKNDTTPQKPFGAQSAASPTADASTYPSPESDSVAPPTSPADEDFDLAGALVDLQAGVTPNRNAASVTHDAELSPTPSADPAPASDNVASNMDVANTVEQKPKRRFNIKNIIPKQNHFTDLYSDVSDMSDIELSDDDEEPDSDAEKEGEIGKKRKRASAPRTTLPVFRPIAKDAPFICQMEFFGNGKPCKFQTECPHAGTDQCTHDSKKCTSGDLNDYRVGTMLGPLDDWESPIDEQTRKRHVYNDGEGKPHVGIQKTARTCIKDYFGRNKNQSQHIDFDPMRVCRKCYQHLSYQDAKGVAKKWPRRQVKMLLHALDIVEQQQVRESSGQPGLWDIKLKTTQWNELNKYFEAKRTKTPYILPKSESKSKKAKGKKSRVSEDASELDADILDEEGKPIRVHNKKEYYAPMKYLRFIHDNFCGKDKTVEDCRNLDLYMKQLLLKGKVDQCILYEHTPQWRDSRLYKGNQPKTPKNRKSATPAKPTEKTPAEPNTPTNKGKGKSPATKTPVVKQESPSTQLNQTSVTYTPFRGDANLRRGHPGQPSTQLAPVPAPADEQYDSDATDKFSPEQLEVLRASIITAPHSTHKRGADEADDGTAAPPAKKRRVSL